MPAYATEPTTVHASPYRARLRRYYAEHRKAGWDATSALRAAKVRCLWYTLDSLDAVRLRAVPDDIASWEEEAEAWGVVGEHRVDFDNVDADGCFNWFASDIDRDLDAWRTADSVWGNTEYRDVLDPTENPDVVDVMQATCEAFAVAWKAHTLRKRAGRVLTPCPRCAGTGRIG
jgi:hypothetical protein